MQTSYLIFSTSNSYTPTYRFYMAIHPAYLLCISDKQQYSITTYDFTIICVVLSINLLTIISKLGIRGS